MPRAAKACATPGCPNHATPGTSHCPEHAPKPWATSDRSRRLPGSSTWARIRAAVLDRDQHLCQINGTGCRLIATEVDHIVAGDDHRLENLQAACRPCNQAKAQQESAEARRRYRTPT